MFYSNRPYVLTIERRIATPVTPLSSSSTGSSYIDQSSISDPHSIDRQLQARQGRSGTVTTTLSNYTNGDSMDSMTSPVPLPRGNGSVKTNSLTSNRQDKWNVVIEADTKLNEYLMIYVDDSVQNIGARSFTNVMKDSSLIAKRLKVT